MTEGFPPHYQRILERYYKRLAQETPVADAAEPSAPGEKSDLSAKAASGADAASGDKASRDEAEPTGDSKPAAEGGSQQ